MRRLSFCHPHSIIGPATRPLGSSDVRGASQFNPAESTLKAVTITETSIVTGYSNIKGRREPL
jgi:hypothetical protein